MNLSIVMDYVLPSNSILYKHCNGSSDFYKSDDDFINGKSYYSQEVTDDFESFMCKLINKLMVDEKESGDTEPLVTIDYAIWNKEINETLTQ